MIRFLQYTQGLNLIDDTAQPDFISGFFYYQQFKTAQMAIMDIWGIFWYNGIR
jgi:hypothetical protein